MSREIVDELFVKQLEVARHVKMHARAGKMDFHVSNGCVGVWLSNSSDGMSNTIGMVANEGQSPYFVCWPDRDFWDASTKNSKKLPFAFSGSSGLQVPQPDGTHVTIPLRKLAELAKLFVSE